MGGPSGREPWEPSRYKRMRTTPRATPKKGGGGQRTHNNTSTIEAIPSISHASFCTHFTVPFSAPIQPLWWFDSAVPTEPHLRPWLGRPSQVAYWISHSKSRPSPNMLPGATGINREFVSCGSNNYRVSYFLPNVMPLIAPWLTPICMPVFCLPKLMAT